MVATAADVLDPLAGNGQPPVDLLLGGHQRAEADDRCERGPQLVAHAGQKVALGGARGLQGSDGVLEAGAERFLLSQYFATLDQVCRAHAQAGDQHRVVGVEQARPWAKQHDRADLRTVPANRHGLAEA